MFRNAVITAALVAAAVPATAHAEFAVQRNEEIRPSAKRVKLPARATEQTPRLSIEDMLGKINGVYMGGLRRCYTKALSMDPTAGGKVMVTFTINPWGRVTADVDGVSEMVESCVTSQARQWRFEIPRDANGKATQETFRVDLMLAPN